MSTTSHGTTPAPQESHGWDSTSGNALRADLSGDRAALRVVAPADAAPAVPATRCYDKEAWRQAVAAAGDGLGAPDRVRAPVVVDIADHLALHMGADGYTRIPAATVARELGRARATVVVALSRLVDLGYLIRDVTGGQGRGNKSVYLAALPDPAESVAAAPGKCCGRNTNDPDKCCDRNTKAADLVLRSQHKTPTAPYRKNQEPPPPTPSAHQPPLPWEIHDANRGGGATPAGDQTPPPTAPAGDVLAAVVAKLPDDLAQQLLADDRLPKIRGRVAAIADDVSTRDLVDGLAGNLPNPTYDIAKLICSDTRLPRLEARARAVRREHAARRADTIAGARLLGDTHARDCIVRDRSEFLELIESRYPDDPAAFNAALAAYDDTTDAIRGHEDSESAQ